MSQIFHTPPLLQIVSLIKRFIGDRPLRVVLIGTDFEVRVWDMLMPHPDGTRGDLFRRRLQSWDPEGRACGRAAVGKTRSHSWCPAIA
jgi:hypothetical protein